MKKVKPDYQKEPNEKFRKMLVELVKASGQEVINKAEELVGEGDMLTNFYIGLNFTTEDGQLAKCPTIYVNKEYLSTRSYDILLEVKD